MASVSTDKSKNRRVIFRNAADRRRIIYLGKVSLRDADIFSEKVQAIINAQRLHIDPPRELYEWIAALPLKMRKKLAAHELAPAPHEARVKTLSQLFAAYLKALSVKGSTLTTYKQTEASMIAHFGEGRLLTSIAPLDCEGWRQSMQKAELASATINRRVKTARRAFLKAVKWKLLAESPMADVKGGSETNRERLYFVTQEMTQRVLDACPDAEWRLMFRLCRYGALRCPSEVMPIKWADVLWDRKRILIRSPKTGERWLPMFPEIESALLEVFSAAEDKSKHVITHRRGTGAALTHQLRRIVRRAGLTRWPRLFHNLRASRLTELAERWPIHVVCAWAGNSERIAQEHYLQITDSHFEAATMSHPKNDAPNDAATARHRATAAASDTDGASKNATPDGEPRSSVTPTVPLASHKLRGKQGRPDQYDAPNDAPDAVRMRRALDAIEGYVGSASPSPGGTP